MPSSTIFQPSPSSARPKASSQMGSCHEKGTYSSAMSIWRRGSVIPAWLYTSAAHCRAAAGRTGSRPGKLGGSERDDEPRTHAGGRPSAAAALPAVLVGEDHGAGAVRGRAGLEEADRLPHHRRRLDLLDGDVLDPEVGVGVLQRVEPVLDRHLPADVLGGPAAVDVGADERGEGAAGAERGAPAAPEGELGVALGLLLERDGQHGAVLARPARARRPRWRSCRPTEPAVCTRNMGLPTAPRASER